LLPKKQAGFNRLNLANTAFAFHDSFDGEKPAALTPTLEPRQFRRGLFKNEPHFRKDRRSNSPELNDESVVKTSRQEFASLDHIS
jgi:hypothetical protein